MTKFTITDHEAAAQAASGLPAAARAYGSRIAAAAAPLQGLNDCHAPAEVLDALAQSRRLLTRAARADAQIMLLLRDAGASPRGIADRLGMHHTTVVKLIEAAEAERVGEVS
ncbi:Uncharacterised protein [Mycobacteroides abscessus subsp. abscessus]|uniref:helix-turn-helix domain-containing protein n=1 Tax=Mycobacteroides abscessus TaxID=36809 RepID=UPI0009A876D9|nr:helix-turn-helix domain-containing protein [Mycobacteroides abscessus]SKR41494.1 Uncharacterised protein [Mycobacteroides abscessus subsp. abscessus]